MADIINFEGLQPEVFTGELTWFEFLEAFSDVIEDNIRAPIRELESIRELVETTDPVIMSNTIKQMGFDIPADIIAHNTERLAKAVYMLPLFHETAGTTSFTKAVSFVLGRSVKVTSLYTRDYAQFYPEPHGALNIDGGEWYKSTHVSLGMESIPSDKNIITAENQSIKDRLMEAFYEFAPINLVVQEFYYIVNMYQNIYITGTVFVEKDKIINIGLASGDSNNRLLFISGPTTVREGSSHKYMLGYRDDLYTGPSISKMPFYFTANIGVNLDQEINAQSANFEILLSTSSPQTFTINLSPFKFGYFCMPKELGAAMFTDVALGIMGGWDGASWPNSGAIGTNNGPITVVRNIDGVNSEWLLYRTDFGVTGEFTFELKFTNPEVPFEGVVEVGNIVPTYDGQWSSSKTGLVAFDDMGIVHFGKVSQDTTVRLSSTYNDTYTYIDVLVEAYNDDIIGLELVGPRELLQDSTTIFSVDGIFADGQRGTVDASLSLVTQHAILVNNAITVFRPKEDTEVYLTMEYTSDSGITVTASEKLMLKAVPSGITLVSLEIQIDPTPVPTSLSSSTTALPEIEDHLIEGEERKFRAIAHFSDGSSKEVQPLWMSSSTALTVSTSGDAVAGKPEGYVEVDVDAEYDYRGVKARQRKRVTVVNEILTIERLSIIGSNNLVELSSAQYAAIATWSDGTSSPIEARWTSNIFTIDQSGTFTSGSVDRPRNVTITAKVEDIVASFVVVVFDTPRILQHITIIGPDNVREGIVAQYTAYAHYSDNTDVEITPDWGFNGGVNNAAVINSSGQLSFDLYGTEGVPASSIVEVQAQFTSGNKTYIQTKPIVLVPDIPIITSLVLSGPTEVFEGERITLSAMAVYADGSLEEVSPIWKVQSYDPVNYPETSADIVSPGILQGRMVEEDTKAVVVAQYFKVLAEYIVTIKNKPVLSPDVPLSSRIIGPPAFLSDQRGSYAHMIEFNGICGERAVSSDWSIDVDPSIAIIDDDGFLYSVNGVGLPITVTSIYECGGYTVEDSIIVTIISVNSSLDSIYINGPTYILTESITPFTAELFRKGESGGTIISNVQWSVVAAPPGITINGAGEVFVDSTVPDGTQFSINVRFVEGFDSVEGNWTLTVTKLLPVYGVGPISVNTDNEISAYLQNELSSSVSNQLFTLDVPPGYYGYFAIPASLGLAVFSKPNESGGGSIVGGWDGATWPSDGSIGSTTGPLTVSRTFNNIETSWFLYRTDSTGLGDNTWRVIFT